MSFATAFRNRNTERVMALVSAVGVLLSMMVIFASPALAHHPELTASQACVDGDVVVTWTSESWLTSGASGSGHSDIRIQLSVGGGAWQEIASGAYTAGNSYSFSGSFDASGYWQQTISLRAFADGPWDNGTAGGQYSSVTQLTINQDCFNPSCPAGYQEYKIDEKPSNQTYGNFTISNFTNGPNGETFDWSSTVPVYQVIVKGGPSAQVYNYSGATSDTGLHAPTNPNNGNYYGVSHVTFCWDDAPPPPDGWVCLDGEVQYMEDVSNYEGTVYESEEEALTDPDCAPPPPPDGWACIEGEVVFIEDASNFEGTLYETQEEAADDPGCIEVGASTTFTIGPTCTVDGVATFTISGTLGEGLTLEVAGQTITDGPFSIDVPSAGSYPYLVTLDEGFVLAEGSPPAEGVVLIEDCTPPPPPSGWACVEGEVVFVEDASNFEGTLYDTQEEAAGDAGCTEVMASIFVTVAGSCTVEDDTGVGLITVTISVDDGATVTVRDADGDIVGSFSSDGSVTVPEDATYTWSATPNEGFEFPPGSDTTGAVTIDDCVETLPFTGLDGLDLALMGAGLLAVGSTLLLSQRRREES